MNLIEQGYSLETEIVFHVDFGGKIQGKRAGLKIDSIPHKLGGPQVKVTEEELKSYTDWDLFTEEILEPRLEFWILTVAVRRGWVDVLQSEDEESIEGDGEG